MNKTSISRILSILSVISIPVNAFIIFGIIIGGGFSSIDNSGFMFWGIFLIFLLSIFLTFISWIKIKQAKEGRLIFSIITLIVCILPFIVTLTLSKYNTQVWEQQKTQTL